MKTFSVKIKSFIWLCSALLLLCIANSSEALNVTIEWDPNAEAVDGYKIYYQADTAGPPFNGTGADQGPSPIDVKNVTTFSITGLPDGPVYYFAVTAYKGTLESGYSNVVSTGTGSSDTTAPTVTSVNPANGSTDVAIDTPITVVFSEAMDASSIAASTFMLDNGATGTVTYDSNSRTASYSPSGGLNNNTIYTATVTTGVKDTAGNAIASDYSWSFTTVAALPPPDVTPPSVSSTVPADSATGVLVNTTVSVSFSEILNCGTVNSSTFYISGVSGTINCFETGAVLTPNVSLDYSTTYTATVTAGISDLEGNAKTSSDSWSFTTEADTEAPKTVKKLSGTAISETEIDLSWVAPTDNVGVTGYKVFRNGEYVATTTSTTYSDTGLNAKTTYNYQVSAYDAANNESSRSSSLPVQTLDTTAPLVTNTSPLPGSGAVALDKEVTVTFSEPMDASTITTATFTLSVNSSDLPGTVTYSGKTATFTPSESLVSGQSYLAIISSAVQDLAGNPMASSYGWSFSTSAPSSDGTPPAPVGLIIVLYVSETGVELTWEPPKGNVAVAGYKIFRDEELVGTSTSTSYSDSGLNAKTTYLYQVSAYDALGNESAKSTVSVDTLDTTAPVVTITSPLPDASGVAIDTSVSVTFSEEIDDSTITTSTFRISADGHNLPGTVTYSGTTATFTPSDDFEFNQDYLVLVSTGVSDPAGNAMANNYSWSFRTGTATDEIYPTVVSVIPVAGNASVPLDVPIVADFSEPMDPDTLTTSTLMLSCDESDIPFDINYQGTSVTFNHTGLIAGTKCTASITTEVRDLAGNPLAADYNWSFMTISPENSPPSKPLLVSPDANSRDLATTVDFIWKRSKDKDGDKVNYRLYYGTSLDFQGEDTQVIDIASSASNNTSTSNAAYVKAFGVLPGTMLLLGFAVVGTLPKRKRDALLIALLITGSLFLTQCGGGDKGSTGVDKTGTDKTTIINTESSISYTATGLQPDTTYYWKVVASDGRGQQTESEVRSFTTKRLGGISS